MFNQISILKIIVVVASFCQHNNYHEYVACSQSDNVKILGLVYIMLKAYILNRIYSYSYMVYFLGLKIHVE